MGGIRGGEDAYLGPIHPNGKDTMALVPTVFDACHGLPFCGRQAVAQVGRRAPQHRVHPVRRDIRERHQHKGPVLHPRMRQHQLFGRALLLLVGLQLKLNGKER